MCKPCVDNRQRPFGKSERGREINRIATKKYHDKIRGIDKKCARCGEVKPLADFWFNQTECRYKSRCLSCRHEVYLEQKEASIKRANAYYQKNRPKILARERASRRKNVAAQLLLGAKGRARKNGLEFDLILEDITVPEFCPVLGMRLFVGDGRAHGSSPTIDRINSNLGYTRGNIIVVSQKANTIKSNATPEEIRMVAGFYSALAVALTYHDQNCLTPQ